MTSLVEIRNLSASVRLGNGQTLTTVDDVSLRLERGASYAIVGKSGSGKTSLISILGLLNSGFSGDYLYDGISVAKLNDRKRSLMRASKIGFVFQNYSLVKHLKVSENVELPLLYQKSKFARKARKQIVRQALTDVGLEAKINELPSRLSGGEQQRVAIARALASGPELLICDEPTGALDKTTGQLVLELLHQQVRAAGATLLLVTHDDDVANSCDTVFRMDAGRISHASNAA